MCKEEQQAATAVEQQAAAAEERWAAAAEGRRAAVAQEWRIPVITPTATIATSQQAAANTTPPVSRRLPSAQPVSASLHRKPWDENGPLPHFV